MNETDINTLLQQDIELLNINIEKLKAKFNTDTTSISELKNECEELEKILRIQCGTYYMYIIPKIYKTVIPVYIRYKRAVEFMILTNNTSPTNYKTTILKILEGNNDVCDEKDSFCEDYVTRVMITTVASLLELLFSTNRDIRIIIDKIKNVLRQNEEIDLNENSITNTSLRENFIQIKTSISYVQYLYLFNTLRSFVKKMNEDIINTSKNVELEKQIQILTVQKDILENGKMLIKRRLDITNDFLTKTTVDIIPDTSTEEETKEETLIKKKRKNSTVDIIPDTSTEEVEEETNKKRKTSKADKTKLKNK